MDMLTDKRETGSCVASFKFVAGWDKLSNTYRCEVILCPEEEGGYSAHCKRLPGVVSQGETAAEALENVAEALGGALEIYREQGAIPWDEIDDSEFPDHCERQWVVVNV